MMYIIKSIDTVLRILCDEIFYLFGVIPETKMTFYSERWYKLGDLHRYKESFLNAGKFLRYIYVLIH